MNLKTRTLTALFLLLYGLLAGVMASAGGTVFEALHIALDASNAMLSGLFALFLWSSSDAKRQPAYRAPLALAFAYVSVSEIAHALISAEWSGRLAWITQANQVLRPATWPPSTYFLPLALLLVLPAVKRKLPPAVFALGLGLILAALYGMFFNLPSYLDTGVAGISRPFQIPVLPLLAGLAWIYWQKREDDPLFSPLVACVLLLFLSDLFMLWSRAPHDEPAMAAHLGKFLAYLLAHVAMVRLAREDRMARDRAEAALRQAHDELEARVNERTAELRASNQALRESQERFGSIVGSAMDAIITVDEAQRIVLFNRAAQAMFGYSEAEALGSSLGRLIPTSLRAAHVEQVQHYGATGATKRIMGKLGVIHALRSNQAEFPAEAAISQIVVDGKKLFTVILRDISDRVRHEEEIQRLNADLEVRVLQRTAELAQSNEALLKANGELQHFAYIAAHDLQTPLRSINSFTQLLQRDYGACFDERGNEWMGLVLRGVKHMQTLIQDLLDYSRVDARARPFAPVPLEEVLEEAIQALAASIADAGARISHDPLPAVMGDRSQLTQLLQNLLGNAIKYHGQAPPRIHVSAQTRDHEHVIAVRDNGIGIAERHHRRIFEPFRRLHTQQEYPGTGIGLAICARVIERHGGCIWLESQPDEGSCFYFSLPGECGSAQQTPPAGP